MENAFRLRVSEWKKEAKSESRRYFPRSAFCAFPNLQNKLLSVSNLTKFGSPSGLLVGGLPFLDASDIDVERCCEACDDERCNQQSPAPEIVLVDGFECFPGYRC